MFLLPNSAVCWKLPVWLAPVCRKTPNLQNGRVRGFKDGKELSGGQWQKIALSRAFMRSQADILILDEPTAAIDAKAEAEIFEHFRELTANKISIIISHRFSTVRRADYIIVLDQAEILERGTHKELLHLDGQYATLFKLQAKGYQ